MTCKEVEQAIRALGLAVTRVDGRWRINYRGGKEATAYYTTDDDDALGMANAAARAGFMRLDEHGNRIGTGRMAVRGTCIG
jgi:hypothetical protein